MPLGPDLITSPEDRNFISSLGNWALYPGQEDVEFVHASDPLGQRNGCARFYWPFSSRTMAFARLTKDYFGPLGLGKTYLIQFWGLVEDSQNIINISFIVRDGPGHSTIISVGNPDWYTWKRKEIYWTIPASFENATRELQLRAVSFLSDDLFWTNGLSIREFTTARTDHLPLMGVG